MSLFLLLLVAVLFLFAKSVRFVPHGFAWTIERFGRHDRTAGPGLVFLVPFVDRVAHRVDMMARAVNVPSQDVPTRDDISVKVSAIVFFQVTDAAKASYEMPDLEQALLGRTRASIGTAVAAMTLNDAMCQRAALDAAVLALVRPAAESWGVTVDRIGVKDLEPPREVVDSMRRQMEAERARLRASKN